MEKLYQSTETVFVPDRYTACVRGVLSISTTALFITLLVTSTSSPAIHTFATPVDALSIGVYTDDIDLAVSAFIDNRWTAWQILAIEKGFDPLLRESNLVMFPKAARLVRVRGTTKRYELKPIRISDKPVRIRYAARTRQSKPNILTRKQWGADDSLLYEQAGAQTARSDVNTQSNNGNGAVPNRVKNCLEAQQTYANEFVLRETIRSNGGKKYRWPQQYSKKINLLAVHHTALTVSGDSRSPVERVRALYRYHAQNREWGDIGYHYLIDENGQIYEGRAGGRYVVGGHIYCNNIGTIGIALLGDFDKEKPTQKQMHSLQWLLDDLAQIYGIDLDRNVEFHGKVFSSPIVGHNELGPTAGPGFYMRETLAQVTRNVRLGNLAKNIRFPVIAKKTMRSRTTRQMPVKEIFPAGSMSLNTTPAGRVRFTMNYAPSKGQKRRHRMAKVQRSNLGIGIWQEFDGRPKRVSTSLFLDRNVRAGKTLSVPLTLQAPRTPGSYWIDIGNTRYTLTVRRGNVSGVDMVRRRQTTTRSRSTYNPLNERVLTIRGQTLNVKKIASVSQKNDIRIRLTIHGKPTLRFGASGNAILSKQGTMCSANINGITRTNAVVTFTADEVGMITVSDNAGTRRYRGDIECRIVDGELTLINDVELEDYLLGLSEEPDTEPYEKQRAFAIAARTYALWYMNPKNRKFSGKPYDGSDSPAQFQAYGGVNFEERNNKWKSAVYDTAYQVLKKNNLLIKPPYFSSDDGRTRSPEERGWGNFPFAEIFSGKPDPWCEGMPLRGHGVGMSGCGAEAQANEGKTAEQILQYYYPGTVIAEK